MIIKIFKLFITFEHLSFFLKIKTMSTSQVNNDLELWRIPRNSQKFSLVFQQFPITPISSKDSFLQTWNYYARKFAPTAPIASKFRQGNTRQFSFPFVILLQDAFSPRANHFIARSFLWKRRRAKRRTISQLNETLRVLQTSFVINQSSDIYFIENIPKVRKNASHVLVFKRIIILLFMVHSRFQTCTVLISRSSILLL